MGLGLGIKLDEFPNRRDLDAMKEQTDH
jgi:hypothetical protein